MRPFSLVAPPDGPLENRSGLPPDRARRDLIQPEAQAVLIAMILNFKVPRGATTATVSPFLRPMIARPTGDSFESLFSAGLASAEPTIWYSIVLPAARSRRRTRVPTETASAETSLVSM